MTGEQLTGSAPLPVWLRDHYLRRGLWSDVTLGQLLLNGLGRCPDQRVRVWSKRGGHEETFASLETLARRIATGLTNCGVRPGDRVVLWLPNGLESAAAFVSLAALGTVIVPVASFYGRKELVDIINMAAADVVFTCRQYGDREYLSELCDSRVQIPSVRTIVLCGNQFERPPKRGLLYFRDLASEPPIGLLPKRSANEVCLLAFTSGTSETAKGVLHTHRTLVAEIRRHVTAMVPAKSTPQIVASPIAHAAGMVLGLLGPIHRAEPIHLVDTFDVDFILDTAHNENLAPGGGAPVFLSALIDHPRFTDELSQRMGYVILGGSPVPEGLVTKAAGRGLTVLRSYGLTEHPTVSAGRLTDSSEHLRCTDGHLLDGIEVEVRDRSGAVLPSYGEGEIFTRGPDRCAGYLQPEHNTVFDAEGWLATGDVGVVSGDGYLAVTARAKDIIIRNGINISPTEVENALSTCAGVTDVALIGVPDDRTGERPVAVVVADRADAVSLPGLTSHLAAIGVAKPKWPEELWLIGELPRTASGKVRKNELREAWSR
jgi:acyl-CoA synthetase (AMP-forming)/AMP-acid ligase II